MKIPSLKPPSSVPKLMVSPKAEPAITATQSIPPWEDDPVIALEEKLDGANAKIVHVTPITVDKIVGGKLGEGEALYLALQVQNKGKPPPPVYLCNSVRIRLEESATLIEKCGSDPVLNDALIKVNSALDDILTYLKGKQT